VAGTIDHRGSTPGIPDRVRNCYMTFGNDNGLVGLKGHLYQRTPGDWRFRVTDPVTFPADNGFRIRVCAPITVAPIVEDDMISPLQTATVNLGADGVLLDGGVEWAPPRRTRLMLSLPCDDEAIEAPAMLAARQGTLCDYRYESMDTATRNRLGAFIIDDQRDVVRRRQARYQAEIGGLDDDFDF
jgi:hypothetical protein